MLAQFIVHWPGKDTLACVEHSSKLVALGEGLGFKVSCTPYYGDEECRNCENDAKKEAQAKKA
jgi:hypothetical protein